MSLAGLKRLPLPSSRSFCKRGEGTWADADQAMMRRIVGELGQSRSKEEFNERLEAITDRLKLQFYSQAQLRHRAQGQNQTGRLHDNAL